MKRGPYFQFMMRELSSLFVGTYVVLLVILLYKLSQGREAYEGFRDLLCSPLLILFHLIALGFSLLHTFTWFNASPKAMVLMRGEEKVPPMALILPNYLLWIVLSALLYWIVVKH
jgi:fumarate reductase subunit C